MRNNKGSIGSGLTWIPAMFIIALILVSHVIFTVSIFGKTEIGKRSNIDLKESSIDINDNRNFLNFLNSEIKVDGKKERVVDAIRFSLDPYFEIKNKDGKNPFNFIDPINLTAELYIYRKKQVTINLLNGLKGEGFSDKQILEIMAISKGFKKTKRFEKIAKQLDNYCKIDSGEMYILGIPQGTIHNVKLFGNDEGSAEYTKYARVHPGIHPETLNELRIGNARSLVNFRTTYRGEAFDIKFYIRGKCL
jgi:hypothetical protein|tara:strand:- start:440 stop:1186 length:747 start_codon:yes stop_codon:yes gene_type:complete